MTPRFDKPYVFNEFKSTFMGKVSLIIQRLSNCTDFDMAYEIVHVPVLQVMGLISFGKCCFSLEEYESV